MKKPILIKDIKSFIGYVSKDISNTKISIFRGQQNTTWDLKAAVFRDKYDDRKEKKINEIIKKYNFDEFSNRSVYFDELIQMQHYGIPTRLLDWSYNPLISLYFTVAYEDNNDGYVFQNTIPKSEIYTFNSTVFKTLSEIFQVDAELDVLTFENEKEVKNILTKSILENRNNYFIDSTLRNNRIRAQQGCFSLIIDKKQKFIDYILVDIFQLFCREFCLNPSLKGDVKKLINYDLGEGADFKDIVDRLASVYRKKLRLQEYKAVFNEYINGIRYQNKDFCDKENITDVGDDLSVYSDEFMRFIESKIKELEMNSYELEQDDLIRYKIRKSDKAIIKKQLENIGITSTFVYPDIQGSIDHIKNIFK
ncbi:FRG domain-containing protein [Labilibacter marinus]|uniref:FRG domain-containing protein n=1 Tax=Labilibacter marinus TaxID=1477105 RepID=UPI000833C4E1|nr:FRG domain-containing protein [Labilibacter marinus]